MCAVEADLGARIKAGPKHCSSCCYQRMPSAAGTCPDCGVPLVDRDAAPKRRTLDGPARTQAGAIYEPRHAAAK